jgi:hypothetical protein
MNLLRSNRTENVAYSTKSAHHTLLTAPAFSITAGYFHIGVVRLIQRRSQHFDKVRRLPPIAPHTSITCRHIRFIQESQMRYINTDIPVVRDVLHEIISIRLLPVTTRTTRSRYTTERTAIRVVVDPIFIYPGADHAFAYTVFTPYVLTASVLTQTCELLLPSQTYFGAALGPPGFLGCMVT